MQAAQIGGAQGAFGGSDAVAPGIRGLTQDAQAVKTPGPAHGARPTHPPGPLGIAVSAITSEEFVPAFPGQHHFQTRRARRRRQFIGRQQSVIRRWIINFGGDLGQQRPEIVFIEADFMMFSTKMPGHGAGLGPLVMGLSAGEAGGEGTYGLVIQTGHQGQQGRAVDAA